MQNDEPGAVEIRIGESYKESGLWKALRSHLA